jgi:murein L,D-transpeptidase YcbB/YkuD
MGQRDDWFEDGEAPADHAPLADDPVSAEDDWLVPHAPAPRVRPTPEWRRIAIVAGAFVALLLAGLAAAGVFSSNPAPKTVTITSVAVTTTTASAKTTPRASSLPSTTLKPGDSGAQVRALQRALKSLGYSVGTIDGQYGPATKTAVASFQHAEGLTEDGVFGPKTLNALIQRAGP